ncbi:MAG TPA: hypothetical protein VIJ39_03625 [Solirubrobacteraceae bacterium]
MSTLLLERSPALEEGFAREADRGLDGVLLAGKTPAHGRLTLDDLITGVWERLAVRATVNCPVCESPMASSSHDGSDDPPTGVCIDCGSRLC